MTPPLIALTTDFGVSSPYVAEMKAVILSALPTARIVDVTHAVPPQSIRHAEVVLRATAFAFPLGTVHVVVVDPGVGTARRGIAVESRGLRFVGPDNGVLGIALAAPEARAVELDEPGFFRHPIAPTFHGRDIFAPVAAELAAGLCLSDVGSAIDDALPSALPKPIHADGQWRGEVLAADRFGNLTTTIPGDALKAAAWVRVGERVAQRVMTYGEASHGELLALVGSDGYVEIAVRDGSAAAVFNIDSGAPVVLEAKA